MFNTVEPLFRLHGHELKLHRRRVGECLDVREVCKAAVVLGGMSMEPATSRDVG